LIASTAKPNRAPVCFWLLAFVLVAYVAACTGQRDNKWGADAWEHHRAVLALTRHLWKPGNPTYASDVPSVRYSPYALTWALVARATGISAYSALSAAAVVNTILLVLGVWLLLGAFGERAGAAAVLIVMVSLYGGAPGYANSYALADLPWHQVNPSAFSFALTLAAWSIFRRIGFHPAGARRGLGWMAVTILAAVAMLDHPMTGTFAVIGLFVIAMIAPAAVRWRMIAMASAATVCVALLCLAWPWYSFLAALTWRQDRAYWFNRAVLRLTLTQWTAPAMLCGLFAIPLRDRPLVRTCLAGAVIAVAAGLYAVVARSPVPARFPLPGLIYLHLAIGVFVHETGILRPSTWPARLRAVTGAASEAAQPLLQIVVAAMLVYCLVPQLISIAAEPHLGRVYVAKILGRKDRQQRLRQELAELLRRVGENDVVLSDPQTSWLIPSVRGRIVAAIHYELFIPDQPQRMSDVENFFSADSTPSRRIELVKRYHVNWIVLDRRMIDPHVFDALLRPRAVIAQVGDFVLMDVKRWLTSDPQDFNRDEKVDATDQLITRYSVGNTLLDINV